jgi:cysteinyl-tRNA synthetase
MTLHVYNTLTRRKEAFEPISPGKVNMYVCGPTVYDYIHIGNARPLIFFDVVYRYLQAIGYDVRYVQNFTDVDDKLIRKSEQTGLSVPEIADRFIAAFYEDANGLKVRPAAANPRVTETMREIIEFIRGLEAKGFAYEKGGDVFFRTSRFAEYGKLSHQNLEELQLGKRIEVDPRKEHPLDFVLWKAAKPGEICWDSPWGVGRPGWHIECSAMVRQHLGVTIDIHGGGHDLQFPHHECEIAQSEALHDKPLAKYWMHNGYIQIDNEKMSKSLGNVVLVKDLRARYKSEAIRFFMLSSHYRSPLNFSEEVMNQAEQSVARLENCAVNLAHRLSIAVEQGLSADGAAVLSRVDAILADFHARMKDDFNTPDAITSMFELVSEANVYLQREVAEIPVLERLQKALLEMDGILGIVPEAGEPLLDEEIERLIAERTEARQAKHWARADEIRDMLLARGIVLEDTPQGVRWRRK